MVKRARRVPSEQAGPARRTAALLAGSLLLQLGLLAAVVLALQPASPGRRLRVDELIAHVRAGRVDGARVLERDGRITGSFSGGTYWVAYGKDVDPVAGPLFAALDAGGIPTEVDQQWSKVVLGQVAAALPLLILLNAFAVAFVVLRAGSGLASFGRSRARLAERALPGFAAVAGLDETIEELRDVKEYLADPARFRRMGAHVPRGILLHGPPGCGKTLLARALAGEAGVPFYSISGSDFVELFVGVGPSRIRDLFGQAKRNAPAILFIDEIDSLARLRQPVTAGGQDEREATLGQLLVEMDGFDDSTGVVVLGATNRIDILDPALLRSGRFDRRLLVDRPDLRGRRAILQVHLRGKPIDAAVDTASVARRTPGLSGADLANVVNEAAILATRRGRATVTAAEFDDAVDRTIAGGPERRSRLLGEVERRVIAIHEAGHAVVAAALPGADTPSKVSIISRGQALAFTFVEPAEERFLATRGELQQRLVALAAGRVAELMVAGDISTGAEDDLLQATRLARWMVGSLGMSTLGPVALGPAGGNEAATRAGLTGAGVAHSEALAAEVDAEVRRLLSEADKAAWGILTVERAVVEDLAARLLELETLDGDALRSLLAGVGDRPFPLRGGRCILGDDDNHEVEPGSGPRAAREA